MSPSTILVHHPIISGTASPPPPHLFTAPASPSLQCYYPHTRSLHLLTGPASCSLQPQSPWSLHCLSAFASPPLQSLWSLHFLTAPASPHCNPSPSPSYQTLQLPLASALSLHPPAPHCNHSTSRPTLPAKPSIYHCRQVSHCTLHLTHPRQCPLLQSQHFNTPNTVLYPTANTAITRSGGEGGCQNTQGLGAQTPRFSPDSGSLPGPTLQLPVTPHLHCKQTAVNEECNGLNLNPPQSFQALSFPATSTAASDRALQCTASSHCNAPHTHTHTDTLPRCCADSPHPLPK